MYVALLDNRQEPRFTMNGILAIIVEELLGLEAGFQFDGSLFYLQLHNIAADDPG